MAAERVVARGPGRVNLIGEHTDYTEGFALPFAIERGVTVTAEPLDGDRIEAIAADLGERDEFAPSEPERVERRKGRRPKGWRAFVRGTVAELQAAGHTIGPCRLIIEGDLPRGAGLSSSAALSTALCLALTNDDSDRIELAKLCSRVENDWVGAQTGLLDQLAALCAEPGHALLIDFKDLSLTQVPLDLGDWQLVTLDSETTHDHAAGGYNERRKETRAAARKLEIDSLRDADLHAAAALPDTLFRRVRHVVTENQRVHAMVRALQQQDLEGAARLIDASHASLRDDYEASTPEVEATVQTLKQHGAAGARMVGGGFGGSVLGLLRPGAVAPARALAAAPGPAARRL